MHPPFSCGLAAIRRLRPGMAGRSHPAHTYQAARIRFPSSLPAWALLLNFSIASPVLLH